MKTILLLSSLLVFSSAFAQECLQAERDSQPVRNLNLTYPAISTLKNPVDVRFELDGNTLRAHFRVRVKTINAKPDLGPKEYPYQRDVVELFISVSGKANGTPYYEFELSPLDQTFEVRIDDLKKPFVDNIKMGIDHEAVRTADGWNGRIDIPLRNLGWDGDPAKIIGNAYAIQGIKPNRSYWTLSIPPQAKPNFHKPEFFKPLVPCRP